MNRPTRKNELEKLIDKLEKTAKEHPNTAVVTSVSVHSLLPLLRELRYDRKQLVAIEKLCDDAAHSDIPERVSDSFWKIRDILLDVTPI